MPPKRLTVYPDARALAVLGRDAGSLNQAIECWADLIARATADNADAFSPEEWCLIADVCNGTLWEPRNGSPAVMLAANVQDGHRLDGAGYRWLGDEAVEIEGSLQRVGAGQPSDEMSIVDLAVNDLVNRLAGLDYVHAWAVIGAVRWFWDHADIGFPPREVAWWTLPTRRKLEERAIGAGDN